MKLYLSGPMSGRQNLNIEQFDRVAAALRSWGHEVVSPAEFVQNLEADPSAPATAGERATYLRKDIFELSRCDGIYLMQGWRRSIGANLELHIAQIMGLTVTTHDSWPLLDEPVPDRFMIDTHITDQLIERQLA